MLKKSFIFLLLAVFLNVSFFAADVFAGPYDTVYITRTGAKYHYRNCRTLARSRQIYEISVQEAKNRGYTACKVCRPPVAENKKVREAYVAHCFAVTDGDTVKVAHEGREVKIRLYGIDCPESGQLFGTPAKRKTEEFAQGKRVRVEVLDIDRYGRQVALVRTDNVLLQESLIHAGLAWVYPQYCKIALCEEWKRLEAQARENKAGLWKSEHSIPPWEWRRM